MVVGEGTRSAAAVPVAFPDARGATRGYFPAMSAPRRLWLYVAREVAGYSLLGLLAITTVLVGNRLFRWLHDVLGAGIAFADVTAILGLFTTLLSVYALPISLLFGILLAIGRMAADSEITAMRACGVGMAGVAVPILALSLALCALLYPITLEVEPRARRGVHATMLSIATRGAALEPGRFEQLANRTLFVDGRDEAGDLVGVMISDRTNPQRPMTIFARSARASLVEAKRELRLELQRGDIHVELPQRAPEHYHQISFETLDYVIDLSQLLGGTRSERAREMTLEKLRETAQRVASGDPGPYREPEPLRYEVHLSRRAALPLAPLLFAATGLPLALMQRRNARALGILWCGALAFGYYALQTFSESLVHQGTVAPALAPWLPNALYAALGIALLTHVWRRGA